MYRRFQQCFLVLSLLVSMLLLCCCGDDVSSKMRSMIENRVELPSNLGVAWGDTAQNSTVSLRPPLFVVHIDSMDCSSCLIPRLVRFEGIYAESLRLENYSLCVIVSPKQDEAGLVVNIVRNNKFIFPVYIDKDNQFDELNPQIPSDIRFHCFLTNGSGYPVFIGDPTSSDRLMGLFKNSLDSLRLNGNYTILK